MKSEHPMTRILKDVSVSKQKCRLNETKKLPYKVVNNDVCMVKLTIVRKT